MEGLKRVLIQGKSYPVFFGMYGFAQIMRSTGLNFGQVLEKTTGFGDFEKLTGDDLMFLLELIHTGFLVGSKMEGEEFPLDTVQLSAHIPLSGPTIETVFQAFVESMPQANGATDQKKAKAKAGR